MELVDAGTLRSYLAAKQRPCREIVDLFVQAGRGLAAAHAVGLVHRDFKPDNALVGADGRVRGSDFGLARRSEDEKEPSAASAGGHASAGHGTPGYMAPEQSRGEADARSDQYAFCLSLC